MVFGFFKKKKPQEAQPKSGPQSGNTSPQKSPNKPAQPQPQQKNKPPQPQPVEMPEELQWMSDSIVQFLNAPSWRIPILTFLDENCIVFDDEEENKFEYTQVHNAFKKLVEGLVEDMINELEIAEEKLGEVISAGLKDPEYRRTFEQLLIIDNFPVFKNLMVKRNKELELEAFQQLQEIEAQKANTSQQFAPTNIPPAEYERLMLEKEQAEIEHALAMSLAVEQEKQRLNEQEDYEMQEALKQSQAEYTKHTEKQQNVEKEQQLKAQQDAEKKAKQLEEEKEKERLREQQKLTELAKLQAAAKAKAEAEAKAKADAEAQKAQAVEPNKVENPPEEVKKEYDQAPKAKKLEPVQNAPTLPPLTTNAKFDPMTLDQLQKEKDKITDKIQQIKQEEPTNAETLEDRKKRLKAQRDLILAKKKAERDTELKNYEAAKEAAPKGIAAASVSANVNASANTQAISGAEAEKRRGVYEKLKSEIN